MDETFDCLVVADPRFAGGSTAALVSDVTAMSALGLKIGLLFVRSAYLDDSRDVANTKALALRDLPGVTALSPGCRARGDVAFLHHPLVFSRGIEERARLSVRRALLVAHHPPFRSDGSLEYNPVGAIRRARAALGISARFAPVSPYVRAQLASFAPLVVQSSMDWPNIFATEDWPVLRAPFSGNGPTVIGRHSRVDTLKFPATGAENDAAYPAGPDLKVRVMGCPVEALKKIGAHPQRWDILAFGEEPVADFLNSLDIFVYFYHPGIEEAFGRTVVEAALCGRPLLLDPRLRRTFGDLASYCTPSEVASAVDRLAANPALARQRATEVRDKMAANYGSQSLGRRLELIVSDKGVRDRSGAAASPGLVAHKLAGHYRRRIAGGTG
ncbi:glycosyltransferase [uncultured Limimaricola sp.]|uniref:glycosyltransferase n=1 Tax=uncultured Limimaricola sp. TaxID=2211667 RepID=UPI0030F67C6D